MFSEFPRTSRTLDILIGIFSDKKDYQIFNNNSNLIMFSRILKEFSKSLKISYAENSISVCKMSTISENLVKNIAGWNLKQQPLN